MPLTPLRYPGGKQRIYSYFKNVIEYNNIENPTYVEPFAGGAGVALELLSKGVVSKVILNDISPQLYCFWRAIIVDHKWICDQIRKVEFSIDKWLKMRDVYFNPGKYEELEVAFSVLYLNRCNRSGIMSGGVIGGKQQKGKWRMDARYNANELIRRICIINEIGKNISLYNDDAMEFMSKMNFNDNTIIYLDPPYIMKSNRLYLNKYTEDDHKKLSEYLCEKRNMKWLLSYNYSELLFEYYHGLRYAVYGLNYSAGPVRTGEEIIFFSDALMVPDISPCNDIPH